jgi:hypothetical protein
MPIGTINKYATLDKNQDYIGDSLAYNRDSKNRFNEQDRAKKEQFETNKHKESNDYGNPDFKAVATNNSSINDLTSKQAVLAQQKFLEFKQKALNEYDPVKKAEYIQGMQRIKNSFEYSSQFPTMLNKIRADIVEGKEKGVYDEMSANENLNSADQLNKGQANLRYDEAGNIRFDVYDKYGKVINENQTFESYASSLNPLKKSTYNDDVLKFASKYKIDETTTKDMNGRETIDQRVNRTVGSKDYNNAMEYAQGILSRENEKKIISREHNIDINDDKKLQEFVVNDLLNGLQSKYSDKQDPNLTLDRAKEARRIREKANDDSKDEQSFTTTPEIPLNFTNAGVKQNKDLVLTVENGKAKPSISFTNKNGTVLNYQNVIPQKVSRVKNKDGKYVYVTEISHLKPTKIYAKGGEELSDGSIAKKGQLVDNQLVQTSETVTLREANALLLLKSKSIKTKEDLRNIFPKEKVDTAPIKKQEIKKEISRADLSLKAKASGYSTKEYEALLIKNGVTIK